ncbi:hypothetical protein H4Q26_009021 [Puccinia striiformis f. sp. tritici PST-130]|nr:hypothetical protein H4Q26_009021 [Puccinia striiformis f. sp. tritici PST-130]
MTTRTGIEALKQYEDENKQHQSNTTAKLTTGMNSLRIVNNTTCLPSRIKCTQTQCQGPHPASECFKKLENTKAEKEWFVKRRLSPPGAHNTESQTQPAPIPNQNPQDFFTQAISWVFKSTKQYTFVVYGNKANLVHPLLKAICDTGASSHMFDNHCFFTNVKNNSRGHESIKTAGSKELTIKAAGDIAIQGVTVEDFFLHDSLYIPSI